MCNSSFHNFLQALPKCEHHLHLEGALTPELLFQLAAENHIQLPEDDPAFASPEALVQRYKQFVNLDDFLHYYYIGMSVLVKESDFEQLAFDYFQHASADGVVHAEVFFDPQAHLSRGIKYDTVLSGFKAARSRAEKEFGISSELICCFLRHLAPKDCLATFQLPELQDSYKRGDVVGIGLDSSEKGFPPELFTQLYGEAKQLGMRRTAHAGEEGPASYIRNSIDLLGVERIDHGISLVDDPELLKFVAEKGIVLSVCPVSNVFLRNVRSMAELPIRTFLDAGVQFSINSDDPSYFGDSYILKNYCAVQDAFRLTIEEWRRIVRAGIEGSWCSDARKKELLGRLETTVDQWQNAT